MVNRGDFPLKSEKSSTLGNDRKIHVQNPPKARVPKLPDEHQQIIESPTEFRYRLQGLAREVLLGMDKRLSFCLRRTAPGAAFVEVRRTPDKATAHFRNLELCNRVWVCPVCAARIANERREEITVALAAAKLLGLHAVLVTYTLRHDWRDKLGDLLGGLLTALGKFKSGRGYQDIKAEYGIRGGIRTLEMTYGENGWHPHVHELLILDEKLNLQTCAGLQKWLADRWLSVLLTGGFDASYLHGVDVRTADSDIADYLAKWGREPKEMSWGIEHEIANAPSKRAHGDGLTPFQLLECYDIGDQQAAKLFLEYAETMTHHKQMVWSAGLRALLVLPEALTDEMLPGFEETPQTYTAVEIDQANWARICMHDLRGALLWLVAAGDWTTLTALLRKYSIRARIFPDAPAIDPPVAPMQQSAAADAQSTQNALFDLPDIKKRYE